MDALYSEMVCRYMTWKELGYMRDLRSYSSRGGGGGGGGKLQEFYSATCYNNSGGDTNIDGTGTKRIMMYI